MDNRENNIAQNHLRYWIPTDPKRSEEYGTVTIAEVQMVEFISNKFLIDDQLATSVIITSFIGKGAKRH